MKIFCGTEEPYLTNDVRFKHNGVETYVVFKDKRTGSMLEINTKHIEKIVGGKDTV
jgi:hypothetical protein